MAAARSASPFNLADVEAYRRWRDARLSGYPRATADLIVPVNDPRALTPAEHEKLLALVRKTNMVIYAARVGDDPDKEIPRGMARQFGLERINHNWLADEDAVTSITVNPEGDHPNFIPYTNRPIKWHTDGYYNTGADQIRAMVLHCVHPAAEGGENALLDHEVAYILLRDEDPELIRALMQPDIMTIPARVDEEGVARDTSTGPVFSIDERTGSLHMRYTARKRNIVWKDDSASRAAVQRLEALLDSDLPYIFRGRLEAGMGLLCNNVLHDRGGFSDAPDKPKRLLYRARYFDRIRGS
jgi:hypothetical protein